MKRIESASPRFALTFDDGPDSRWTPPLLDLLAERKIHATFFLLTKRTRKYPSLVERIRNDGHEIALHGDDHSRMTTLPLRELSRRLVGAKAELEDTAGLSVRLFRPPFGAQSIPTYVMTRKAGLDVVVWGPHAEDWIDGSPSDVAGRALGTVKPGDILLLHDGLEVPVGDLPPTFDRLKMFEILLDGLSEDGIIPDSIAHLVPEGRVRRTAWFRP